MCLRILHVVGIMSRGGTETLLMNLYRRIDREKIQFDFAVHSTQPGDYDQEILSLGGKIYYFPKYTGFNHLIYLKKWRLFFQTHPEHPIIHGHIRSTAAFYLTYAKKYHRKTIAHSHSTSSRGNKSEKIVKRILQYPIRYIADYFFACSLQSGIWLFGKKICKSNNFQVLHNTIDSKKFIFQENIRKQKRRELDIENRFVIGHVGNFDNEKNHPFLIDIMADLCQKDTACCLVLAGGGNLTLQKKIQYLARQKGVSSHIKFLGSRSDISDLLNAFDIFLLPSLHEGLGIAAIEAQANGLRCILSDTVPQEVQITDLAEFISLKQDASVWAEKILSYKNNRARRNMQKTVISAGYDISSTIHWMTDFYLDFMEV